MPDSVNDREAKLRKSQDSEDGNTNCHNNIDEEFPQCLMLRRDIGN